LIHGSNHPRIPWFNSSPEALAKALVDAFANAPAACGAALQALSAAAPWAMVPWPEKWIQIWEIASGKHTKNDGKSAFSS
jgi:hypothetical protein